MIIFLYYRKNLQTNHFIGLIGVVILKITGCFIQMIFHVQLIDSFMSALGITLLGQFANNPYAYLDFSTQVFNREYFNYWMWEKKEEQKKKFVLCIYLDELQNIQDINDSSVVTKLLKMIAKELWSISTEQAVFKVSYNQFIICSDSQEKLDNVVKKVTAFFENELKIDRITIICSVRLCILNMKEEFYDINILISYADYLVCNYKNKEKLQLIEDNSDMYNRYIYEKEVEKFLNEAIEKDLFEVWYQPVYSMQEKKYVSIEALSRLKHPKLGWISPEVFIRIAMEKNLIFKIMPLQIKKICIFFNTYKDKLDNINNIKINLSAIELEKSEYIDMLIGMIEHYKIALEKLQFEITESVALNYSGTIKKNILKLNEKGIGLCMDDFGTGYSNLSKINSIPFSVIKLDRSLLNGICDNQSVTLLYKSMIDTFRNLGYAIVSEGVETLEEVKLLEKLGADMIQGYYYARPQDAEKVIDTLSEKN